MRTTKAAIGCLIGLRYWILAMIAAVTVDVWRVIRLCLLPQKKKLRVRVEGSRWRLATASAGAHRGGFGHGQRCYACPRRQHGQELITGPTRSGAPSMAPPLDLPPADHMSMRHA
eukprot:scaffold4358_cov137-Isochrysis_galbana.AAC.12